MKSELSWVNYQGTKAPVDGRSEFEIAHERVLKAEEDERNSQIKTQTTKESGLGGYHSVILPMNDQAKEYLNQFKSGGVNFVQLSIEKEQVIGVSSKTISVNDIPKEVHITEPRFYVYNFQKMGASTAVFIYCCPEKSPPKLRMVYSTAKPGVVDQIFKLGISLAPKKIEVTSGSELTEEFLRSETNSTAPKPSSPAKSAAGPGFTGRNKYGAPATIPEGGDVVKAKNVSTIQTSHPIYSLMTQTNTAAPGTKKKIVIPPKGAW